MPLSAGLRGCELELLLLDLRAPSESDRCRSNCLGDFAAPLVVDRNWAERPEAKGKRASVRRLGVVSDPVAGPLLGLHCENNVRP
jgi:hypothetical protein